MILPTRLNMKQFLTFLQACLVLLASCTINGNEKQGNSVSVVKTKPNASKPGSSFSDTVFIKQPSALFYYPDSLQDLKLKNITEPAIYNSSVHEMFYQMRNARKVIIETYPALKIVEAKKYRYILIQKKSGRKQCLDLNQYNDARGLFIIDLIQDARLVDMTNIETELYNYFQNR